MSRNFKILFLLVLLNLLQIIRNATISKCTQLINNTALYSLNILIAKNDLQFNFTIGEQQYTLFYNFCINTQKECNGTSSYAIAAYNVTNPDGTISEQCFHLSNLKNYGIDLIQKTNFSRGIEINMEQNDNINQKSSSINVYCNHTQPASFLMERMYVDPHNSMHFIFEGESQYGCPTELSTLWSFLSNNKYFFFVFLAILGAAECLYGYRFIILTFFLLGFATGFLVILIIVSEFINILTLSIIIQVLILFGSGVIGLIVGYGATSLPKIGVVGLGIWLGLIVALMLNGIVFHKIHTNPPNLILYILIGIFCIGFAVLTFWFWKKLIIISTSFVGAYMFVRAFSLIFKGFPNEFTLQKQLNIGAITSLTWKFYVYLVAIVLLGLLGIFFQIRNQNTEEADKKMEGVKFELKIPFLHKNHHNKEGDQENNLEMQELNNSENFQFEQKMREENMRQQNSNQNQQNFQQSQNFQYTRQSSESLRGSNQNQKQQNSNNQNEQNIYESPVIEQQFFQQQNQGNQYNQQNFQNNNNMMNNNYNQNYNNQQQQGQTDENFTFQPNFDNNQNNQQQNYQQQQFDNNQQYYQGTDSLQQQFYDNQGQDGSQQQVQQEKKRKKKKKHHDQQQQPQDVQNNFQPDYSQTQNYQDNQQFQDLNNQQQLSSTNDNFNQQPQQQFPNNQNFQQEIPQFSSEDNNNFNQQQKQQQLEDINIDNQQQGDNQEQAQGQSKRQKRKKK